MSANQSQAGEDHTKNNGRDEGDRRVVALDGKTGRWQLRVIKERWLSLALRNPVRGKQAFAEQGAWSVNKKNPVGYVKI